ncbi:hypothetical protein SLEP1_g59575 [Rubroshorea leprosula]|uniref:Retrotransposon gag domain-containing protein n=1 Tax=Rubroshorea leprosula TaxID=152421 RepID=A0AAV5MWC6_9ROSI|nr:hypothetical protein SLEP1_g59575 [Rubroshorea leprosula]
MSEENAVTNPEKSAVDERVDKLEATMQTMAATLQTISLTLSTLATGSVPSPPSLVPTTPAPPILIPSSTISPGNRAKDPMVTQLQFPSIYENQPLMGESSSHVPQIPSLSHPPLEVNDPTLPATTPFALNIPPSMGQVPTFQPTPSIEIFRPTLEIGKSKEVDHKLQQLEEALKAMQGPQAYGSIDLDDLCYYPGIQTNFKFKQPDFDKYDGSGCPYAHLQMYARKMAPYANDERVLIHYFQDSLSGPASVWFSTLDKKKIRTFKDVSQAFMRQYEYNMSLAPTRDSLQRITKKSNETFKEFAQRWRSEAAKVIPPLTDSEICSLFIKSTTGTFRAWLAPCVGYTFAQLVTAGEQIEDGLKTGIIMDFQAIQKQLEQVKMGNVGSTSKKFTPGGRKEDEEALSHISTCHAKPVYNVAKIPHDRQPQLQYTPAFKPTPYSQRRPNFNAHAPVRQQFLLTNRPRQFTKLPIPYSEVLKQLVAVGLVETLQTYPIRPPYPHWYDLQAKCEYHNVVGHSTEHCTALKHKIQDLIDEGKLQLDAKDAPNITQNPLPSHDADTMNMVTFDEVEKPVLENVGSWSLDELFAILIEYDLIQPIAQMSLNVSPIMIDDALVCPYHSNMKGHALRDCEDFQKKVKELQAMGSLKFMSAQESEKCIAQFKEVAVDDSTDEICSDDEEDYFGLNNLFGSANMTDPKERWRRMLAERAFMEKHPNFQLIHHAKAPMDPHESVLLETVKEESLCDSWGNLTINALDEEGLEFDRGISLVNGSSQANWAAELLPQRMAATYNKKVRPRVFHQGDPVLRKIMPNERDPRGKFASNYEGPYVVKEAFFGGALLLKYPDVTDYHHPVNADAVKMFP